MATTILIAITLIAAIGIAGFVFGLFGSYTITPPPPTATISPQLYASASNVGLVNELANFSVTIFNPYGKQMSGEITISSAGHDYLNATYSVVPKGNSTSKFSQVLRTTGIWELDVHWNGTIIGSYTFDVELNTDQAMLKIDQNAINQKALATSQMALYVAVVAAVAAVVSAIAAVGAWIRKPSPNNIDNKPSSPQPKTKEIKSEPVWA